jgi:hypothetical protein
MTTANPKSPTPSPLRLTRAIDARAEAEARRQRITTGKAVTKSKVVNAILDRYLPGA